MSDDKSKTSDYAVAQQTQEKVHLYFVSLVFTLLALSIQSAKFGSSVISDVAELVGWLSLLVSGLASLSYLEGTSHIRVTLAKKQDINNTISEFELKKLRGAQEFYIVDEQRKQNINETIEDLKRKVIDLDDLQKKQERPSRWKYCVARYIFLLGLVAILLSRAYGPMLHLGDISDGTSDTQICPVWGDKA